MNPGNTHRIAMRTLCAALLLLAGGCVFDPQTIRRYAPPRPVPHHPAPQHHAAEDDLRGIASWYGNPYHGRQTANGEVYDMHALTAAHRTLPFGARVLVRRSDNGRAVEVRINDRGPFFERRVIDLSREAARRIGMLGKGTAPVELELLYAPADPHAAWSILVGGFAKIPEAQKFAAYFDRGATSAHVRPGWHGNYRDYHVRILGFSGRQSAARLTQRLRRNGYGAFIVRTKARLNSRRAPPLSPQGR